MGMGSLAQEIKDCLHDRTVLYDLETDHILSGHALWFLGLRRWHELRDQGFRSQELLFSCVKNKQSFLIDLLAALNGNLILVPFQNDFDRAKIDQSDLSFLKNRSDFCMLLMTSGTQEQKVVGLTQIGIRLQLQAHLNFWGAEFMYKSRLCISPWNHAFGLVLDLMLGIAGRQTIFFASDFSIPQIHTLFKEHEINYLCAVPRIVDWLLKPRTGLDMGVFKHTTLHFGGARLRDSSKTTGSLYFARLVEGYGLTECGPGVLMDGYPIDCELRIALNGELWVKSDSHGYWKEIDIEATGNWIKTGDRFKKIGGRYIMTGRTRDLMKGSNGLELDRTQIEDKLLQLFKVSFAKIDIQKRIVYVGHDLESQSKIVERIELYLNELLGWDFRCIPISILEKQFENVLESRGKSMNEAFGKWVEDQYVSLD